MDRRELAEVARKVCAESTDLIMQLTRRFYLEVSGSLGQQSWEQGIYGHDFDELWDDALFTLQSLVSSQIANDLTDLFETQAYLEDLGNSKAGSDTY